MEERDALLAKAIELLQADQRIVAAWLFGSLGRGDGDDLSDLDIFVVVADEHCEQIIKERDTFVAQLGTLALILEAPQNAPPEGSYLMTLYRGEEGPQQVDWYWQPQKNANIPLHVCLLFDKVGLYYSDSPQSFEYQDAPERDRIAAANQTVRFFWVMLFISAKYIVRQPRDERMGLLQWVIAPLREVEEFLCVKISLDHTGLPATPEPAQKIALLKSLGAKMELLMPLLVSAGGTVPEDIAMQVYRFLDLADMLALAM